MDAFCFAYQHLESLYTLFEYRFGGKIVAKSGKESDYVKWAVYFNQRNREWTKCPALQKKTVEEKVQNAIVELFPTDKINANNCIMICTGNWTSYKD